MKKGIVLLISAIAFGGIISTGLTSCSTQVSEVQGATVKILTHGDLVQATIENEKETYKKGDTIKVVLTFKEGYGLSEITLNGVTQENTESITLEAGQNVIQVFVKNLTVTEGTTNIRDFVFEEINGGKEYAITSYTPTGIYPTIAKIPEKYLGKPVTELKFVTQDVAGENGLIDTIILSRYLFGGLKGVHIPASIKKIDPRVFRANVSLTQIIVDEKNQNYSSDNQVLLNKDKTELVAFPQGIEGEYKVPDSVKIIGNDAFYGCQKITKIDLNKVIKIGDDAFRSCKRIKEIVIPDTVTELGKSCFSTSVELEKITLSNNLKVIPESCFYKNSALKEIHIPSSVQTIGEFAFFESVKLEKFTMDEGVKTIKKSACSFTAIKSLEFPSSLREIAPNAFSNITRLESVSFKEGVETIGENSFYKNLSLKTISLPASLTSIGKSSFFAALSLREFKVAEANPNYTDVDGVLFTKDKKELVAYPSAKGVDDRDYISEDKRTYVIPEGTERLGFQCFSAVSNSPYSESYNSYSINKVVIPSSVKFMNQSFYMALLSEIEYKGTSEQFAAIDTGDVSWDYEAVGRMELTCTGDSK